MTTPYTTPGLVDVHAALFSVATLNDVVLVADDDGSQHGSIYRGNGATWVPFLLTPATIQPSITNTDVLTTVGGVTAWSSVSGAGGVPATRTVFGTSPIRINGGASDTLAADVTISALNVSNTTAGVAAAITATNTIFSSTNGTSGTWNTLSTLGIVPTSRTLTGTAPITIGGGNTAVDLSANRTIAINNVSNIGPGAAAAITASNTIFSTTNGVTGTWNSLATLGIVATSYTLSTSGPITLDGTSGGSGTLASAHTIGILSATTSGLGAIQLTDDLDGTATAPDVIAATGLSGTFTVRCTALNFTTSGTITNSSGNMAVSAAVGDLSLSSAAAATLAAGTIATITSGGTSNILLTSANDIVNTVPASNVVTFTIGTNLTFQVAPGKIVLSNHTLRGSGVFDPSDAVKVTINGTDYWIDIALA